MGVCRITFGLPGNDSLKGKRRVVRRVLDRSIEVLHVGAGESVSRFGLPGDEADFDDDDDGSDDEEPFE